MDYWNWDIKSTGSYWICNKFLISFHCYIHLLSFIFPLAMAGWTLNRDYLRQLLLRFWKCKKICGRSPIEYITTNVHPARYSCHINYWLYGNRIREKCKGYWLCSYCLIAFCVWIILALELDLQAKSICLTLA